ncbi:hypothetical protein [Sporomusa malonica]|uniref:Uncharacterized protein n=1 Tax=Sporomusa malonica TaxID=112901 RepID=A0A1W2EH46_9FIRM|nr:hypothetical protein [Sporomusa malonica]SMD09033.1 hypothetical protein SAMN04488500_12434 [Sporomusa malonica]
MCGMNWYREQLEMADDDIKRLSELLKMMEERYKLSHLEAGELDKLSPDIIAIYHELTSRKNLLLTQKSPQV